MKCPSCGSTNHRRYRSPRVRQDAIVRRHRCLDCRALFVSVQIVLTGGVEAKVAFLQSRLGFLESLL
ncbi:MAG: hypothetical protein M0Z95_04390 [Actinomycetota bacterium]|nr:hypothetical protein [Actinomycetota bacterium]